MKITADKDYLKKVVDKADFAIARWQVSADRGKKLPTAKSDYLTASHYFTYLGVKALADEELCEELEGTLEELIEEDTTLKPQLAFLHQFIQIGRWIEYDPDDNPWVEELEKDFEEFFNRVPIDKARKKKEELADFLRLQRGEKDPVNPMYG